MANGYTVRLNERQRTALADELRVGNYRPIEVPYALAAGATDDVRVVLYTSGSCVVQGKGARDFVENVLEPRILGTMILDSTTGNLLGAAMSAEAMSAHIGVDESGKGDFFGPLVIAAVYTDPNLSPRLREVGAVDSKQVASDKAALEIAARIRAVLGPDRYALVRIGNPAYNRLYARMRSVNRILAWAHAKAIGEVLDRNPSCPMALSDQFGTGTDVRDALRRQNRSIELRSRPRAESDIAVAAASLLAREAFLSDVAAYRAQYGDFFPKGATHVRAPAEALVRANGPVILMNVAKAHFRTTDQVLAATGFSRNDLPPEGRVLSAPRPKGGSF